MACRGLERLSFASPTKPEGRRDFRPVLHPSGWATYRSFHSLTGRVRSPHATFRPQAKRLRAVNEMSLNGETQGGLRPPFFRALSAAAPFVLLMEIIGIFSGLQSRVEILRAASQTDDSA